MLKKIIQIKQKVLENTWFDVYNEEAVKKFTDSSRPQTRKS